MLSHWLLALWVTAAPQVTVDDDARVDADGVARGVEGRLGADAEAWTIEVSAAEGGAKISARSPGRAIVAQAVSLPSGASIEERTIMVASAAAFAIEAAPGQEQPASDHDPDLPATANADHVAFIPPWWIAAQGHAAVGLGPLDPSGGIALDAGRWLGPRRHVRASASVGWVHARNEPLTVHAVRPGVQVDAGAALCEKTWLGAGIGVGAVGGWAFDRARASAWALSLRVPVTLDVVLGGPVIFRGSAGVDVQTPSLRFRGASRALRWGTVRPFAAAALGLRFG
ncbi:MAG: hypothetical protein ACE37F_31470 [Nannocystaceae bacterium]|nr:hypothetical protein [bacterium]